MLTFSILVKKKEKKKEKHFLFLLKVIITANLLKLLLNKYPDKSGTWWPSYLFKINDKLNSMNIEKFMVVIFFFQLILKMFYKWLCRSHFSSYHAGTFDFFFLMHFQTATNFLLNGFYRWFKLSVKTLSIPELFCQRSHLSV